MGINTSDKTKMAYYVIYCLLKSNDQINDKETLREFLKYGMEQCDAVVDNPEKVNETKSWYKKAIELTNLHSFEELKNAINKRADEYGFSK